MKRAHQGGRGTQYLSLANLLWKKKIRRRKKVRKGPLGKRKMSSAKKVLPGRSNL